MLLVALLSILVIGVVTYLAHEIWGHPSACAGQWSTHHLHPEPSGSGHYPSVCPKLSRSNSEVAILPKKSKRFIISQLNQLQSCYQRHTISEEEYLQQADELIDELSELLASA